MNHSPIYGTQRYATRPKLPAPGQGCAQPEIGIPNRIPPRRLRAVDDSEEEPGNTEGPGIGAFSVSPAQWAILGSNQ